MRLFFIQLVIVLLMSNCQGQDKDQSNTSNSNVHKVIVQEVIHTTSYTYLRVKENNNDNWLAVKKMEAELGGTYYYDDAMEMKNFHSKELGKDFEVIYFLDQVRTTPEIQKIQTTNNLNSSEPVKPTITKSDVKVERIDGGITIAELFSNSEKYAGKIIKVKGKVTKYNAAIMKKNWIHLQDGTDSDGKFDLVVTSSMSFKVGDIVTIEGKVAINKDFGYGYKYDVIVEEAIAK